MKNFTHAKILLAALLAVGALNINIAVAQEAPSEVDKLISESPTSRMLRFTTKWARARDTQNLIHSTAEEMKKISGKDSPEFVKAQNELRETLNQLKTYSDNYGKKGKEQLTESQAQFLFAKASLASSRIRALTSVDSRSQDFTKVISGQDRVRDLSGNFFDAKSKYEKHVRTASEARNDVIDAQAMFDFAKKHRDEILKSKAEIEGMSASEAQHLSEVKKSADELRKTVSEQALKMREYSGKCSLPRGLKEISDCEVAKQALVEQQQLIDKKIKENETEVERMIGMRSIGCDKSKPDPLKLCAANQGNIDKIRKQWEEQLNLPFLRGKADQAKRLLASVDANQKKDEAARKKTGEEINAYVERTNSEIAVLDGKAAEIQGYLDAASGRIGQLASEASAREEALILMASDVESHNAFARQAEEDAKKALTDLVKAAREVLEANGKEHAFDSTVVNMAREVTMKHSPTGGFSVLNPAVLGSGLIFMPY